MTPSLRDSLVLAALGLLFGVALHFVVVYFRDNGPEWPGFSLRGNGAIILLLLAPLALILGEVWAIRRRAWVGAVLFPITLLLGLFGIFGGV